jgi:hypothetical protein
MRLHRSRGADEAIGDHLREVFTPEDDKDAGGRFHLEGGQR